MVVDGTALQDSRGALPGEGVLDRNLCKGVQPTQWWNPVRETKLRFWWLHKRSRSSFTNPPTCKRTGLWSIRTTVWLRSTVVWQITVSYSSNRFGSFTVTSAELAGLILFYISRKGTFRSIGYHFRASLSSTRYMQSTCPPPSTMYFSLISRVCLRWNALKLKLMYLLLR